MRYLCTLNDGVETDMITALLENNGIPVFKRRLEMGDYLNIYMGMSIYGVRIYVPAKFYRQANQILSTISKTNQSEIVDEEFTGFIKKENSKRRIKVWVIIAFIVVPTVFFLILTRITG